MRFITKIALFLLILSVGLSAAQAQAKRRAKPPAESGAVGANDETEKAAKLFDAGQTAHQSGRLEEAIKLYGESLALDPALWQAEFQRAAAYFSLNRLPEARDSLSRVTEQLKDFTDSPDARKVTARVQVMRGEIELATNQPAAAEAAFRLALEADPNTGRAHAGLAQVFIVGGKFTEAIGEAKTAIATGDDRALNFALLGQAQLRGGKNEEAQASLDEALKREPNNALALRYHAELAISRNDLTRAIADLQAAAASDQTTVTKVRLAAAYRRAKQFEEAAKLYRQIVEADPANAEARAALAEMTIDSGKVGEAITQLEALIKADPNRAALHAQLAELYLAAQPEKALAEYALAAKLEPSNLNHKVAAAAVLVKLRRFEEAVSVLRQALAQPLKDELAYTAHANLATALFELKDYANAAPEYVWLLKQQKEQKRAAITLYLLGICFDKLGDYEQALKAYNQFLSLATSEQQLEVEKIKLRLPSLQRQLEQGKGKRKK